MSYSDSSSSSSDRELTPPSDKLRDKGKKKSIPIPTNGKGKNEGPDPNWDYKPPAGVTLLQGATDAGEFDWDTVANDDDTELWLIRVPESVCAFCSIQLSCPDGRVQIKPKYLENIKLEFLSSTKKKISRVATLDRKHATFDIWSVGVETDADIGGEEIEALSCLLPRKSKKGKHYTAPKPIARHLVVSAQAVAPTPDPASTGPIQPYSRPPRENYPKEVLTHSFKPYGSLGYVKPEEEIKMDVDVPAPSSPTQQKKVKRTKVESPEMGKKNKKTKGSAEANDDERNQMDVDVTPSQTTLVPSSSPTQKKVKHAKAESASAEKEKEKTKGKKRKGEGVEASAEKKTKKVKTS
ncbi:hypothetical protein C0995_012283 [Termitomyces sp. Mi166|nr:hypothetical protein C0995_012283 [Termitomyces sp. Mi166\